MTTIRMRAVTFDVSIPNYLISKALGPVTDAALFGRLSGVRLRRVPEPTLPGPDWVRLEVLKAGICGSDTGLLTYSGSPAMEPFASFPAVLGHEVLARVIEAGRSVRRVEVGQRVAVDPVISCTVRGFAEAARCRSCAAGHPATCERAGERGQTLVAGRPLRRGISLGFQADLPGGWAERMIAHQSQLFAIDDRISDRTAVLMEPLAVGLHAVLQLRAFATGPVLVIGSGPIALGTIWALRAAGFRGALVAQVKRATEAEIARRLGADVTVSPGVEARQALLNTGARGYTPIIGGEVYAGGGFPLIFDCVGGGETLGQALRFAAPRGVIAVLGCAAEIRRLDLTFVWARELDVRGYVCYGIEDWRGERVHTFQIVHDLLLERPPPLDRLVTHVFPLAKYREALVAATNRQRSGSIKVLLDPTPGQ
jgi:threonine dehydrogenase-like Zn-dependent dehydrogenase